MIALVSLHFITMIPVDCEITSFSLYSSGQKKSRFVFKMHRSLLFCLCLRDKCFATAWESVSLPGKQIQHWVIILYVFVYIFIINRVYKNAQQCFVQTSQRATLHSTVKAIDDARKLTPTQCKSKTNTL